MKGSVLVTGGARRIGLAICDELAARGWRVLAHSRDPGNPLAADFARSDAGVERLFAAAIHVSPDLCAVVNNAALFSIEAELPQHEADALHAVNVAAPVRLTELLAEHLARRKTCGCVVNMLDTRILKHLRGAEGRAISPYAASKLALARATLSMARRFAPAMRVNGVAPGPVLAPADKTNTEKGGSMLLPRRPSPRDVASAVAFLLEAEATTGQILAVDSGQDLLADVMDA